MILNLLNQFLRKRLEQKKRNVVRLRWEKVAIEEQLKKAKEQSLK